MAVWSLSSPVNGGSQTGFTSPTATIAADLAPTPNGRQYAVTALGGTQGSATANSISSPMSVSLFKPATLRVLPAPNPITGARGSIPNNQWKMVFRKGGNAASGVPVVAIARLTIDVPAGMDTYNPDEVRAMMSFLNGAIAQNISALGDSIISGVL